MVENAMKAVQTANDVKVDEHTREMAALKEHTDIQGKLDRLVDLMATGDLAPSDYRAARTQFKERQVDIIDMLYAYDRADEAFGNTMEQLAKIALGAYENFKGSNRCEKREWLNFVFSNLSLKGSTLCYT